MSNVMVVIREDHMHGSFKTLLDLKGLQYETFENIPKLFRVLDTTVENFPIIDDMIDSLEDADEPKFFATAAQAITMGDGYQGGSWPIVRHIHRDLPWKSRGLRFPVEMSYECSRTGVGVDYYSIDSGMETNHPEWGGREVTHVYVSTPNADGDDHGHGTGTASASCGETVGFARSANLFSAKCLEANGTGTNTHIANAINAAISMHNSRVAYDTPAVVNMSLSGSGQTYDVAISAALDAGMIVVAAAGNDMAWLASVETYPAEQVGVISVGGTMMSDLPYNVGSSGSNYGLEVDILAGSQYCWCGTWTGDVSSGYKRWNGTSFGCGYVSGAIACMLEGYGRLENREQVEEVRKYVYSQATFGRYKDDPRQWPMTPAILYLDPSDSPPEIPTLRKRNTPWDPGNSKMRVSSAGVNVLRSVEPSGRMRVTSLGLNVLRSV